MEMAMEIKNLDYNHLIPIWEEYLKKKTELDYTTMYIHVPYCAKKCSFCMYDTHIVGKNSIDNFLDSIEKQFQIAQPVFKDEPIKALYVGGGSPSILNVNQMGKLFNMIEKYWDIIPNDNMFNFEMHPSQTTDEKIKLLSSSFINRVSMGVQSLDERVVRASNRIWLPEKEIIDKHQKLIEAFSHKKSRINIDLLHGLPMQSKDSFFYDVNKFISLNAPNITIYSLRDTMACPVRDGKVDFVKNFRPIESNDKYHEKFIRHIEELKTSFPEKYIWMGTTSNNWEEFNTLQLNDKRFYFYHTYCPEIIHYNNILSFGLGGHQ
ncbi:MAG: radical SAM protein, partial [bacterium]